jgi:hypothetical protein
MSDLIKIFLSEVEEIAHSMKECAEFSGDYKSGYSKLDEKLDRLTERIDKLLALFEDQLGNPIQIKLNKGKRMKDIKKRIQNVIDQHPGGIRPPQIARIIGTKVQNLYPHLKFKVELGEIEKDRSGIYSPIAKKTPMTKTG